MDGDRREKRERKERIEGGKREKEEGEKKKGRKSVFVQTRAQNLKCSNQNPYS